MIAKIDKVITVAFHLGMFFLVVTVFDKDITTNGPFGTAIALTAGIVASSFSRPIMAKLVRYKLILITIMMWWVNIYLMSH